MRVVHIRLTIMPFQTLARFTIKLADIRIVSNLATFVNLVNCCVNQQPRMLASFSHYVSRATVKLGQVVTCF